MDITEHTSTRLKLETPEFGFGLSKRQFAALAFAIIGIVIFCSAHLTKLHCDRIGPNDITCQRTSIGLLDRTTTTIKHLQGAEVQKDSKGDTYRIILINDQEIIPLTNLSTSHGIGEKRAQVLRINDFINNPQAPSINVKQDDRLNTFGIGGLIIGLGTAGLLEKQLKTCTFDKETGQLSIIRQNIFSQSETKEESLDNIKAIQTKENQDKKGNTTYSLKAVLTSDTTIYLGSPENNPQTLATTISQFLDIDEVEG